MLEGNCHCGAVGFRVASTPKQLVDCNCSICRKLGVLWAHVPRKNVELVGAADATLAYSHDDRNLAFHSCRTCGCTTHWIGLSPDTETMAVNGRLIDPAEMSDIPVRRFDGAETWKFLDE